MFWVSLGLGVLLAAALAMPLPLLALVSATRRSAGRGTLLSLVAAATALSWGIWVGAYFVLHGPEAPTQHSQFAGLNTLVAIGLVTLGHVIAGATVAAVGSRRSTSA